ncbi:MAG TPA: UDP-N-acetylmuramoyl-L-alanine--D-glutamate ligase [Candidatus Binatia bacterium]|jgi:UDP-N-acetylmuramoylalanine--D-glutamate ligase|nr:UDP-N-acetylmuramoyl-L-alanine--D-glutamate ligase [Candidatus Binatia bacterium]
MRLPRRALVIGFRRTGQAVARLLASREVAVRVSDAQTAAQLDLTPAAFAGIELRLGDAGNDALLDGIDLVVPSPGVPREAPLLAAAVRRGVAVQSEIELAFTLLECPVVAITGTNGKSTTTMLVGAALERSGWNTFTGGNLGTPLVTAVDQRPDVAVAEVSTFQLEWVARFRPRVGCLLNVTPDHLDRHADFAEYHALKARLFAHQWPEDWAVLNRDDPETWRLAPSLAARVVSFGMHEVAVGAFPRDGHVVLRLPDAAEERYDLGRTRLVGRHNVENILAAVTVARLAGASATAIAEAIDAAEPLPHRLALVAERAGVRWYDDSKATNVGAAVKSLESFDGPVLLVAGGVDKGGDYAPLAAAAAGKVRCALVLGAARDRIAAALATRDVPIEHVTSLDAAVAAAASLARAGDTVLLAPACASFDMFKDYAARGRAFRAAVEALR